MNIIIKHLNTLTIILSILLFMSSCKKEETTTVVSKTDNYKLTTVLFTANNSGQADFNFSSAPDGMMDTVFVMSALDSNVLYKAYVYTGSIDDGQVILKSYTDSACTVYDESFVVEFNYVDEVLRTRKTYYQENGQLRVEIINDEDGKTLNLNIFTTSGDTALIQNNYYNEEGEKDSTVVTNNINWRNVVYDVPSVENGSINYTTVQYSGNMATGLTVVATDSIYSEYENSLLTFNKNEKYNSDGELVSKMTSDYEYNTDGNLISNENYTNDVLANATTNSYDEFGNLVETSKFDATNTLKYTLARRYEKID